MLHTMSNDETKWVSFRTTPEKKTIIKKGVAEVDLSYEEFMVAAAQIAQRHPEKFQRLHREANRRRRR